MYINKIDDLLDKIIDDFYNTVIIKNPRIDTILSETNFVKFQKELNEIMKNYIATVSTKDIRDIVKKEDLVLTIIEIIKRYIAFYLFLFIGFYFENKRDAYINNIVEFTRNQAGFGYKIENFFNSENNSILISFYNICKDLALLLDVDQNKFQVLIAKPNYKEAAEFISILGQDFVNTNFRISNKKEQAHNIIKTIILLQLYQKIEKKEVFRILEMVQNETDDYIFIDVVMPKKKYIDYASVENILTKREITYGLAEEFWNYILASEQDITTYQNTIDDKILKLINSGLLVPIVDDFLLYHKDTEKYDKHIDASKLKKKEDTKIRYVVTKIDSITDYYSEAIQKDDTLKQNVKKNFYVPLLDRKATLVNSNEDIRIITKLINQGRKSIESNEYYNDLVNYKTYPYINFKDFEKYGFSMALDKTIDVVRKVAFDTTGDFYQNVKNPLQTRVGAKELTINIVGFMIPTNLKHLNCLKVYDVANIHELGTDKNNNAYNLMLEYLKGNTIQQKDHQTSVYWLFDMDKDKVNLETYEHSIKLTNQEQVKLMIDKLYNDLCAEIRDNIIDHISKKKEINIAQAFQFVNKIEGKTLEIPRDSDLYLDIESYIYYDKSIKTEPAYDVKEDIFHGMTGDIIILPSIHNEDTTKMQIVKINVHKGLVSDKSAEIEEVNGICQHNITWENIVNLRKKNPGKYTDILYLYIEQYVKINNENEFVCKSCGTLLNIKNYITDGEYNNDTQKFVSFGMPLNVPLEDIQEYSKFKGAIKSIDKLIEKVAIIANITYYTGTKSSRFIRKTLIKDIIDIVQANNIYLKKDFKERNIMASKLYGVSRDLSNLFVFELDNTIFIFSSKEKDYYKHIKHNNIIAYLIILMVLEINESHISFIIGDKKGLCNYAIFDKYGHALFDGLKIRKNKEGDVEDIKKFRVLCYMLYIISCMITKYNMWYYENQESANKKKFNPVVQKMVIHTVVDILNSIIENSSKGEHSRIYDVVVGKFYRKLYKTYNNDAILHKFSVENKSSQAIDRKTYVLTKREPVLLSGIYKPQKYTDPNYNKCRPPMHYTPRRTLQLPIYYNINNITNCPTGEFHDWKISGDTKYYICKICKQSMENMDIDPKKEKNIHVNFRYNQLKVIAQKYCRDGALHNYVFNDKKKTSICIKCNMEEDHEYSNDELDKLDKKLEEIRTKYNIPKSKSIETATETTYQDNVFNKINDEFKKNYAANNKFQFIESLIDNIQQGIGTETGFGLDAYLRDNIYIIDHDNQGFQLDKPIRLTDKDNKISIKHNHPIFKTDVLFYSSFKAGKVDVFYDANTLILLGYKESNKDIVFMKNTNKRIKIIYSIANKLKYMGYESKFININEKIDELKKIYSDHAFIADDDIIKEAIKELIRIRISNFKKIIYEMQRFINRVTNNYIKMPVKKEEETKEQKDAKDYTERRVYIEEEEKNEIELLAQKYSKKLNNIALRDEHNKHIVFKHWKAVESRVYAESLDKINLNIDSKTKLLNVEDINQYDDNGNLLLFYIVSEMNKLIKYNTNKFIKVSIAEFFIDFINILFDIFNMESKRNNFEIRKFLFSLSSSYYLADFEAELKAERTGESINKPSGETSGIYEEYKEDDGDKEDPEKDDQKEDDKEEQDSIDVDFEPGEEGGDMWGDIDDNKMNTSLND
jgi:hypothetical protein